MEGLILRTGLSAILDEPNRQRSIHDPSRFKFTFRRAILVHSRRVSLCRTLDQIRSALSRACFHGILSVRSDSAPKDSSLSISHGRCRALFVYLLLLSISEFIGFSWAYLIAAVASIALI